MAWVVGASVAVAAARCAGVWVGVVALVVLIAVGVVQQRRGRPPR